VVLYLSVCILYTEELGKPAYFEKYNGRKDLGNTQPGDGPRFKGRGFLQTTGRVNYDQFKQAFGVDVIEKPEVLAELLFEHCDWQSPETLIDEWDTAEEFDDYPETYGINK
jgi:hypothetical protein